MENRKSFLLIIFVFLILASCRAAERSDSYESNQAQAHSRKSEIGEIVLVEESAGTHLKSIAAAFNAENGKYQVVFQKFEDERTLAAAVASGEGPDIFVGLGSPSVEYSDFAFEDLLPYMEAEEEYGRGIFPENLWEALTADGSLYWLPASFQIKTFFAPESLVGSCPQGVSMERARVLAAELGEDAYVFPAWMDRDTLMDYILDFSLGRYVDRQTGICHFDSPDFAALLEACGESIPEIVEGEYNPEVMERSSLLDSYWVRNVWALARFSQSVGGDYSFVGFPNEGSNGSLFELGPIFAISSASDNKEGAWEFIRFTLSENIQALEHQYLPVNTQVLEEQISMGLAGELRDESGETAKLTPSDADKLFELMENTRYLAGTEPVISSIILDEAAAYFAGDKTAQEAAELIQSRVSIYVSEQSG